MQKIESSLIGLIIGLGMPLFVTFLWSGGTVASLQIPCTAPTGGICTIFGTQTMPQLFVSTANLGLTLLTGLLGIFAAIFGVWGAIEYMSARGGRGGGNV